MAGDALTEELNAFFAAPDSTGLAPEILAELQSILRLHSTTPQELFYKWESYSMKMGDETKLDLDTARAFKKDLQELLERESRGKPHVRGGEKRVAPSATPRNISNSGDIFGMLDGLVPNTPRTGQTNTSNGSTVKRKAAFETPSVSKVSKTITRRSPTEPKTPYQTKEQNGDPLQAVPFAERPNAGQTMETLNEQLPIQEPPIVPPAESRIKLTANTDLKKFSYRPMAMHLSEASEVLDDRIDEFMGLVQAHHGLEDSAFGNPSSQSTSEIVAVGRIASDALEGKLNAASAVLETSRRMGAGLRVPLKLESVPSYAFYPGQIVALRGTNASGDYFSVSDVLDIPLLPMAASLPPALGAHNARLRGGDDGEDDDSSPSRPLNILLASGPYTTSDSLAFDSLHELCEQAKNSSCDSLLLMGPFLDVENPLLASGDFDLPDEAKIEPDRATITDAFRVFIGAPLRRLAEAVPSITIILMPSVRDAISKHVSWPQEPFPKKELGLPRQARVVSNPVTISMNEIVVGMSAQDVLNEMGRQEVTGGRLREPNALARLPHHLIEQRHFFPLFPPESRHSLPRTANGDLATGAMLDTSYLKLGEWLNVRPDILITPSVLTPFAKVVESVLVVNPGTLSKRKGAGTYAQLTIYPLKPTEEGEAEGKAIPHRLFERGRVDIIRI